jgi:hypothetical protein
MLALKTVLLLDVLQLLLLSAGTLISLEDIMFPLNTFYYKQDTCCLYVICSELSSGIYCRVKLLSTDVSEVRTASIIPARDSR